MNLLLKEIKSFSASNWWIYVIFLICIWIIGKTNTGNIIEISLVFFLHFLGDVFVMMMGDYLKKGDKKKGSYCQIASSIVFNIIGFYAFIFSGKPNYLISNIMFLVVSLKHYFEDIKGKNYKIFNYKFSILLGIIVLMIFNYFGLIHSFWQFLQVISFILFAIFLIVDNEKIKYFGSLFALGLMVLAGSGEIYNSFLQSNIVGVDISYTLLPLTVFVFYLKNLKSYL